MYTATTRGIRRARLPLALALSLPLLAAAHIAGSSTPAAAADNPNANNPNHVDYDPWPGIRKDVFGTRALNETSGAVILEAPVRAEDAAIVPLSVRIPATVAANAKSMTLIIDKNPAPVVAKFTFGAAAGGGDRIISTRVRVDMYSNVRAVVETADGSLHMATKFVKAAGGCSAPAMKDADEALANIGKMQVRSFETAAQSTPQAAPQSTPMREGQLMIKHPQYSGMQMNQLTGLYIPAKFVEMIEVKRDGEPVMKIEGGISLSEDPNIRFSFGSGTVNALEVTAKDTDGKVYTARHEPKGS